MQGGEGDGRAGWGESTPLRRDQADRVVYGWMGDEASLQPAIVSHGRFRCIGVGKAILL